MGAYHLGAAAALQRRVPGIFATSKMIGSSAGSLAAAAAVAQLDFVECLALTERLLERARAQPLGIFTPRFSLVSELMKEMDSIFPSDIDFSTMGKRLNVVVAAVEKTSGGMPTLRRVTSEPAPFPTSPFFLLNTSTPSSHDVPISQQIPG